LWLQVATEAFEAARDYGNETAKNFLLDPTNPLFNAVALILGYEPEALRQKIREILNS
jgi:hypothetical protein